MKEINTLQRACERVLKDSAVEDPAAASILQLSAPNRDTLKCFADEVKVIILELNTVPGVPRGLYSILNSLSKRFNESKSACPQCECHKEEKAEIFLRNLLKTLQRMNNEHC
ncbi:interleukin 15%2C like isoform X2 [Scomber scombrus]|uniref:Interleukin 15, like isoform X2 n=1 Tax=Scomber scombrus TaxID=13677 RepID=A0AAV1Q966_SCOSC